MNKMFGGTQKLRLRLHRVHPTKVLLYGYITIISIGTFLLMLPVASRDRLITPFIDSLFTAASATCVTGLVVFDTYTHWSLFGQIVILCLIQIGGLGFVTLAIAILTLTSKKIGFGQRIVLRDSIAAPRVGGIVRLARLVIRGALIFEGLGTILLSIRFIPRFGVVQGIYFSAFHSISAFCNAGFDLMGSVEQRSSITHFSKDPLFVLTMASLIIVGGLGFFVWDDLRENRLKWKKYKLHTKLVITTTALLITVGTIVIIINEYNYPVFGDMNFFEKVLNGFFHAVTPRTAGFNTLNISELHETTLFLTIALMLIGGSSGSTAGGMKTTTFAVLALNITTVWQRRTSLRIFHRRIDDSVLRSAVSIVSIYAILFFFAAISISQLDGFSMTEAFFESASAIGTVGLSTGITDELGVSSKLILTFLMYFGRVGCLTIIFALRTVNGTELSKHPLEKIAVG